MNSPPAPPRLRRSALVVCAAGLVGLGALLFYGSPAWLPFPDVPTLGETTVPPPDVVQLPPAFTKQAQQYGDIATPPDPAKTEIVASAPGAPTAAAAPPAPGAPRDGWLQTLHPFPSPPTPTPAPGRAQGEAKAPAAAAAAPPSPPKKRWELLAKPDEQAGREHSRPGAATEEAPGLGRPQERGTAPGGAAQGLIQPARWAIPAEPLRTIYRSQTLHGQLLQALHSDIPGQVKINLIVPVLDKFGYNTVILPANTLIIAVQEGRVTYGATRLALKLEQLELPSGEVVELRATVGDDAGSNGMKGKVNNHYGKLILGTGLSALLNIGIKTAVGTPGKNEFFRDPLQEAAEDVGQAVQRLATDMISRELQVRPTITIPAGTLCTLSLQENMQFNRVPLVAR
jgi:type IV secretory pathway VirB10-like protein